MEIENRPVDHRPLVLVAENDDSNFKLIKAIIGKKYEVQWARNGEETVPLLLENRDKADAILMDIKMPVMNGLDAIQRIRRGGGTLPTIIQTTYVFSSDRENAVSADVSKVLVKSMTPSTLRSYLSSYLSQLVWQDFVGSILSSGTCEQPPGSFPSVRTQTALSCEDFTEDSKKFMEDLSKISFFPVNEAQPSFNRMSNKLRFFLTSLFILSVATLYAAVTGDIRVSGVVMPEGESLPGAPVLMKGTYNGTATDVDGGYTLIVPVDATLIFSFIGLKTTEQKVNGRSVANAELLPGSEQPDEVMAVAYATAKKYNFTGVAFTVKGSEIVRIQVSNVSRALEGMVPDLQANASSGQSGTDVKIRIRGIGSINASSAPLYAVDGVFFSGSISFTNPKDTVSLTVLRDAVSAVLYGSRGTDGVVIITTRQGQTDSETMVSIKASSGDPNRTIRDHDRIGTDRYFELYWEMLRNQHASNMDKYAPQTAVAQASKGLVGKPVDGGSSPYGAGYSQPVGTDDKLVDGVASLWNVNRQKEMERRTLHTEMGANISGGGKTNRYYLSAGRLDDKGTTFESGYQRFNLRSNISSKITRWLHDGVNMNYAHSVQSYPVSSDTKTSNVISVGRLTADFCSMYGMGVDGTYKLDSERHRIYDFRSHRPSGSMANWSLPAILSNDKSKRIRDEFSGRTPLEVTPVERLKLKTSLNFGLTDCNTLDYTNPKISPAVNTGGGTSRSHT